MSKQRSLSELQIHECSILKNIEQRPYSENIRSQNNVVNNARVSSNTRDAFGASWTNCGSCMRRVMTKIRLSSAGVMSMVGR